MDNFEEMRKKRESYKKTRDDKYAKGSKDRLSKILRKKYRQL